MEGYLTLEKIKELRKYMPLRELSEAIDYSQSALNYRIQNNSEFDVKTAQEYFALVYKYVKEKYPLLLPLLEGGEK